jgi:hypothetical protein
LSASISCQECRRFAPFVTFDTVAATKRLFCFAVRSSVSCVCLRNVPKIRRKTFRFRRCILKHIQVRRRASAVYGFYGGIGSRPSCYVTGALARLIIELTAKYYDMVYLSNILLEESHLIHGNAVTRRFLRPTQFGAFVNQGGQQLGQTLRKTFSELFSRFLVRLSLGSRKMAKVHMALTSQMCSRFSRLLFYERGRRPGERRRGHTSSLARLAGSASAGCAAFRFGLATSVTRAKSSGSTLH